MLYTRQAEHDAFPRAQTEHQFLLGNLDAGVQVDLLIGNAQFVQHPLQLGLPAGCVVATMFGMRLAHLIVVIIIVSELNRGVGGGDGGINNSVHPLEKQKHFQTDDALKPASALSDLEGRGDVAQHEEEEEFHSHARSAALRPATPASTRRCPRADASQADVPLPHPVVTPTGPSWSTGAD